MCRKSYKLFLFILLIVIAAIFVGCNEGSSGSADDDDDTQSQNMDTQDTDIDEIPDETSGDAITYMVVDTGQALYYDRNGSDVSSFKEGDVFKGQDAEYLGAHPDYRDNEDGTVSDLNTSLMWQQDPGAKMTWDNAMAGADTFTLAGYDDWRLPTIKELYSLILFSGIDVSGIYGTDTSGFTPFIDTNYFNFQYGDTSIGERIIDSQWATSSIYESTTMGGESTMFGVNFADGRIKGHHRCSSL